MRLTMQFIGAMSSSAIALFIASTACAADHAPLDHAHDAAAGAHTAGDTHAAAVMHAAASRTAASYAVPEVRLVRQDGAIVNLPAELNDDRPVVLAFVYTSCTTVCPMTSHALSQLQAKLGPDRDRVHLVSISIDPEQDTPARLREYANTFNAGPEWQHYTGTRAASEAVQRAFDVYRGAKMDHSPATFVRPAPGASWIRIDGFATADQLFAELPAAAALRAAR